MELNISPFEFRKNILYMASCNNLPKDYKAIKYLESNGSQYIDTGYKFTSNNIRVVLTLVDLNTEAKTTLFGSYNKAPEGNNGGSSVVASSTTAESFKFEACGSSSNISLTLPYNEKKTIDVSINNGSLNINNNSATVTGNSDKVYNFYLFAHNNEGIADQCSVYRLYKCKIYDNNVLVRDYLPCTDINNNQGLYDKVGKTFYQLLEQPVIPSVYDFAYTGAVQSVVLYSGTYKLQVWGAQGGYRSSSTYGGKGGYSIGTITIPSKTTVYIYVGGSGRSGTKSGNIYKGGFNGGGYRYGYYGGGGASDIRIGTDSLYARVIVAGGGGSDGATGKKGMYGGGTTGGSSTESYTASSNYCGKGGTATYSGYSTSYTIATQATTGLNSNSTSYYCGGFGFGGGGVYLSSGYGGAGGGGWYGGSGTVPDGSGDDDRGGGGGSGYVYTSSTYSQYPSGCLLNSKYYLTSASTTAGNASFTSTSGGSETGHTGDGYARITKIS